MPAHTTAPLGILTVTALVAACANAQTTPPRVAKHSVSETPADPGAATKPPNAPLADDSPSGVFLGASPFEARPSGPQPLLVPTPPRPPGTDPTPKEQAQAAASCGTITQCGVCNNWGYCGFCLSTKKGTWRAQLFSASITEKTLEAQQVCSPDEPKG